VSDLYEMLRERDRKREAIGGGSNLYVLMQERDAERAKQPAMGDSIDIPAPLPYFMTASPAPTGAPSQIPPDQLPPGILQGGQLPPSAGVPPAFPIMDPSGMVRREQAPAPAPPPLLPNMTDQQSAQVAASFRQQPPASFGGPRTMPTAPVAPQRGSPSQTAFYQPPPQQQRGLDPAVDASLAEAFSPEEAKALHVRQMLQVRQNQAPKYNPGVTDADLVLADLISGLGEVMVQVPARYGKMMRQAVLQGAIPEGVDDATRARMLETMQETMTPEWLQSLEGPSLRDTLTNVPSQSVVGAAARAGARPLGIAAEFAAPSAPLKVAQEVAPAGRALGWLTSKVGQKGASKLIPGATKALQKSTGIINKATGKAYTLGELGTKGLMGVGQTSAFLGTYEALKSLPSVSEGKMESGEYLKHAFFAGPELYRAVAAAPKDFADSLAKVIQESGDEKRTIENILSAGESVEVIAILAAAHAASGGGKYAKGAANKLNRVIENAHRRAKGKDIYDPEVFRETLLRTLPGNKMATELREKMYEVDQAEAQEARLQAEREAVGKVLQQALDVGLEQHVADLETRGAERRLAEYETKGAVQRGEVKQHGMGVEPLAERRAKAAGKKPQERHADAKKSLAAKKGDPSMLAYAKNQASKILKSPATDGVRERSVPAGAPHEQIAKLLMDQGYDIVGIETSADGRKVFRVSEYPYETVSLGEQPSIKREGVKPPAEAQGEQKAAAETKQGEPKDEVERQTQAGEQERRDLEGRDDAAREDREEGPVDAERPEGGEQGLLVAAEGEAAPLPEARPAPEARPVVRTKKVISEDIKAKKAQIKAAKKAKQPVAELQQELDALKKEYAKAPRAKPQGPRRKGVTKLESDLGEEFDRLRDAEGVNYVEERAIAGEMHARAAGDADIRVEAEAVAAPGYTFSWEMRGEAKQLQEELPPGLRSRVTHKKQGEPRTGENLADDVYAELRDKGVDSPLEWMKQSILAHDAEKKGQTSKSRADYLLEAWQRDWNETETPEPMWWAIKPDALWQLKKYEMMREPDRMDPDALQRSIDATETNRVRTDLLKKGDEFDVGGGTEIVKDVIPAEGRYPATVLLESASGKMYEMPLGMEMVIDKDSWRRPEATDAGEVRGAEGQVPERRDVGSGGEKEGREDIQRTEGERAEAREREAPREEKAEQDLSEMSQEDISRAIQERLEGKAPPPEKGEPQGEKKATRTRAPTKPKTRIEVKAEEAKQEVKQKFDNLMKLLAEKGLGEVGVNRFFDRDVAKAVADIGGSLIKSGVYTFAKYVEAFKDALGDKVVRNIAGAIEESWDLLRSLDKKGRLDDTGKVEELLEPVKQELPPKKPKREPEFEIKKDDITVLDEAGLVVSEATAKSGNTYHRVTGNLAEHGEMLDALGASKPITIRGQQQRGFFNGDPTERLARALREGPDSWGADTGGPSTLPDVERNAELRERREREDRKPDLTPPDTTTEEYVGRETKRLIQRGLERHIPEKVINEQIEDVAMVTRAFREGRGGFVIANQAGTGKTYVLGGAIKELARMGVRKFIYNTMNQRLIKQIQNDLKDYGIENVEFMSYAQSRKRGVSAKDAVIIYDESQNVANVGSNQGKAAQALMAEGRFTIFASATPFKNPVHAEYLDAAGMFESVGGHKEWAKMYGAETVRVDDPYSPDGFKEQLRWTSGSHNIPNLLKAREWLKKAGMWVQRKMQLSPEMVDAQFQKNSAKPEDVQLFNRVQKAMSDAIDSALAMDSPEVGKRIAGEVKAYAVNLYKRVLEASKVDQVLKRADELLAEGQQVVIFTETKAERPLGTFQRSEYWRQWAKSHGVDKAGREERFEFPQMVDMMAEWRRAKSAGERPGPQPFADVIMAVAKGMHDNNLRHTLPSVPDMIKAHFKDKVVFYTGRETPSKADHNLNRWLNNKVPVLVATMAKGGTGLSLHDVIGDMPKRTQLGLNLPWTAIQYDQTAGRLARYGTAKPVGIEWFFVDNITFDKELAKRVGGRMADMGALVKGIEFGDALTLEDFDFESGFDPRTRTVEPGEPAGKEGLKKPPPLERPKGDRDEKPTVQEFEQKDLSGKTIGSEQKLTYGKGKPLGFKEGDVTIEGKRLEDRLKREAEERKAAEAKKIEEQRGEGQMMLGEDPILSKRVIQFEGKEAGTGAVLAPSAKEKGKWQLTWWDSKGFSHDRTFDTKGEGIEDATRDGLKPTSKDLLAEAAKSESFKKGNRVTEAIALHNQLTGEAARKVWDLIHANRIEEAIAQGLKQLRIEKAKKGKAKPKEEKPRPEQPEDITHREDRLIAELDAHERGNAGKMPDNFQVTGLLQELGTTAVPGVRLQEAEAAGKLRRMYANGEITKKEWDDYVADLNKSGKVSAERAAEEATVNEVGEVKTVGWAGRSSGKGRVVKTITDDSVHYELWRREGENGGAIRIVGRRRQATRGLQVLLDLRASIQRV
jgi:hypothetical protein